MMEGRKEKFACVMNCTFYISQAFRTFWLSELRVGSAGELFPSGTLLSSGGEGHGLSQGEIPFA